MAARDADAGYFLAKVSEWAPLLRADNTPSCSAALGGWVSIQSEPRKWSRRWLELREHALFAASSESVRAHTYAGQKLCAAGHDDGHGPVLN